MERSNSAKNSNASATLSSYSRLSHLSRQRRFIIGIAAEMILSSAVSPVLVILQFLQDALLCGSADPQRVSDRLPLFRRRGLKLSDPALVFSAHGVSSGKNDTGGDDVFDQFRSGHSPALWKRIYGRRILYDADSLGVRFYPDPDVRRQRRAGWLNVKPPVADTLIVIAGGFGPRSNHMNSSISIFMIVTSLLGDGRNYNGKCRRYKGYVCV